MDETQRQQIVKMAGLCRCRRAGTAGAGQGHQGRWGALSAGIGKFCHPPWARRGGGWKGLLSTLSRSPTVWLAIAAATVTAAVAFADYISGAKQAREALESMNETGERLEKTLPRKRSTASSEGLSFFGMSDSDFSRQTQSAQDWLDGLLKVLDRRRKGNGRDRGLVDGILQGPHCQHTRGAIQPQGHGGMRAVIPAYRSSLPKTSKRWILWIRRSNLLLKKRPETAISRNLTRSGCRSLFDTREAIEIKYNLTPADTDGF